MKTNIQIQVQKLIDKAQGCIKQDVLDVFII